MCVRFSPLLRKIKKTIQIKHSWPKLFLLMCKRFKRIRKDECFLTEQYCTAELELVENLRTSPIGFKTFPDR